MVFNGDTAIFILLLFSFSINLFAGLSIFNSRKFCKDAAMVGYMNLAMSLLSLILCILCSLAD